MPLSICDPLCRDNLPRAPVAEDGRIPGLCASAKPAAVCPEATRPDTRLRHRVLAEAYGRSGRRCEWKSGLRAPPRVEGDAHDGHDSLDDEMRKPADRDKTGDV